MAVTAPVTAPSVKQPSVDRSQTFSIVQLRYSANTVTEQMSPSSSAVCISPRTLDRSMMVPLSF